MPTGSPSRASTSSTDRPRRALVTGAYGYLGSRIRAELDRRGWETHALVRRPRPGDRATAWSLGEVPPVGVLRGSHALVHAAYDFTARTLDDATRSNVDGTRALLDAARAAGVERVISISSLSAYTGTRQVYGRVKLAVEQATLAAGGIAVRPGLVYGDVPGGIVGAIVAAARGPVLPIIGASSRQYPVHEDDVARAVASVLGGPQWEPTVLRVAEEAPLRFGEIVSILLARRGRSCRLIPVPWQPVWALLRCGERLGVPLPFRSDSILGLVHAAPDLAPASAFSECVRTVHSLAAERPAQARRDGS